MDDVTGDTRSEQEPWQADKDALSAAGVPPWAQVTGDDDSLRPRLFVWVNDGMELEAALVGEADGPVLRVLMERAAEVLRADNAFGTHGEPADLAQPTALAVVHEHAVGHGSMGRASTLSLAEVLSFAQDRLERSLDGEAD